MLPLQSPLEAYRADLSRHPNRTDFGWSDTVWLLVAHCLHRLSRAQREARRSIAENCASAIGDLASTVTPDTPEESDVVGETAPMARTASSSVRRLMVATESMVWMLPEGLKAVRARPWVLPAMPERLNVGSRSLEVAFEEFGNWLAKTTAPTASATIRPWTVKRP